MTLVWFDLNSIEYLVNTAPTFSKPRNFRLPPYCPSIKTHFVLIRSSLVPEEKEGVKLSMTFSKFVAANDPSSIPLFATYVCRYVDFTNDSCAYVGSAVGVPDG